MADVLLDRVQLGIDILLPAVQAGSAEAFCGALAGRGLIARRPRGRAALREVLKPADIVVPLDEGGRGTFSARIRLVAGSAGCLRIGGASSLVLNPLRDLRTQLEEPGELALDGRDNLVWPHGVEYPHLLGWQLANVGAMVEAFLDRVAEAADVERRLLRGRLWVQQCEVCRDHAVPDAEAIVGELARRPIPGAEQNRRLTIVQEARNAVCVGWRGRAASSPECKAYAKRADLLRLEVAARSRNSVRSLLAATGRDGADADEISGASAARQLAAVAVAARPLLDEALDFVGRVPSVPSTPGLDLLLGFAPLLHVAAPAPRAKGAAGRRPSATLPGRARRAIAALLQHGQFDARGLGDSDAVLCALRQMAAGGTLTAPRQGRRLFTVAPGLDGARRALQGTGASAG